MARRPNLIRSVKLTVMIPEDLHAKLALYLYSESELRVPVGAYQRFFVERITEFFNHRESENAIIP